jgi:hypothetical protein
MNTHSHLWDCETKEICPGLMIEAVKKRVEEIT